MQSIPLSYANFNLPDPSLAVSCTNNLSEIASISLCEAFAAIKRCASSPGPCKSAANADDFHAGNRLFLLFQMVAHNKIKLPISKARGNDSQAHRISMNTTLVQATPSTFSAPFVRDRRLFVIAIVRLAKTVLMS